MINILLRSQPARRSLLRRSAKFSFRQPPSTRNLSIFGSWFGFGDDGKDDKGGKDSKKESNDEESDAKDKKKFKEAGKFKEDEELDDETVYDDDKMSGDGGDDSFSSDDSDNNNKTGDDSDTVSKELARPRERSIRPFGADVPRAPNALSLALNHRPIFPGLLQPVRIREKEVVQALNKLKRSGSPYIGVFFRPKAREKLAEDPQGSSARSSIIKDLEDVSPVGTLAQVLSMLPLASGDGEVHEVQAFLMGHRRIQAKKLISKDPVSVIEVEHFDEKDSLEEDEAERDSVKAYRLEIIATMKELLTLNPLFKEQLQMLMQTADINNPALLADLASSLTSADGSALQEVLATFDIKERLAKCLLLLKKELEISRLQSHISKQVEENVSKNQRKFLLNEQLKSIKKELGLEKDDKEELLTKFEERLGSRHPTKEVLSVIQEEKDKISHLEPSSSEFNVSRNYLDWLSILPWGIFSKENFEIERAQTVLDDDHYGLSDVKDRILEFIAVGNLLGQAPQGRILCLVGPPGVGKTSIGRSIARALDRKFYRFSVGGLTDVAEIKGHRRTYVGAMPGKLIQCLKSAQTANPVVLIDEIDKLSRGVQGDPASALLEVLDPEQNSAFMDHYLDVPVDLSKVLFICTANTEESIPRALADRIEFIRLSGYIHDEKVQIAQRYLSAEARKRTGITPENVVLTDSALDMLIRWYCREAGVRELEKKIEKIYRKAALRLVKDKSIKQIVIDEKNLEDFVGKPVFTSDRLYEEVPEGVVTGLAWTSMGGSVLYIEAAAIESAEGKGSLQCTGHLGDVMKESSSIAYSVSKQILKNLDGDSKYFANTKIHLHVPEGATPKEGPSAGITMVTALISLATGQPVVPNLAMTGEVSLTGKVLRIGGVKEKTIAARRAGVTTLIFPESNRKDFDELPENIKENLQVHFCSQYDEVRAIAFKSAVEKKEHTVDRTL